MGFKMASRFVLTAQLQLQAPTNVRAVVSQIRKQLQGVNVNIGVTANTRQLTQVNKQFQNVSKSAQGASKNVKRLGTSMGEAARRFSVITIATGSLLALARSIKNATKEAIEFEREVVRIAQVTGKTTGQLKGMTAEVTRLATVWGVSSKEILTAARTLAQAGFSADKAQKALKILAQTSLAATFNNISDTTEGAIALLNQFRKEASQTGGEIVFLERSLGAINAVSKKFAVESKDLISVVRRTGGVFEAAGGSINELIALFTSVRSTTRETAETIATGFRTIFTRVQRVETIEQLRKFGIELQDLEGRFVGPMEAVKRLSVALAGLDPKDFRFNLIVEQLGGFRQIGKVIPLIKQFSVAQEALKVAQSGSGSIARDAATAQQALAVQIQKVREEFAALVRSFADSETFRTIAKGALSLANAFIKVASALEPLLPMITTLFALKIGRGLAPALGAISGVKKFAAGGLVPGSGNRDTVPAMLTPGEFVIKKSSVNKMGSGTLAAMNENRFKNGTPKKGVSALTSAETRRFKHLNAMDGRKLKKEEKAEFENLREKRKKAGAQGTKKGPTVATLKNDIVGGLFLQKGKKTQTAFTKIIPEEKPLASRGNMSTVKTVKGNIYAGLLKKDASTALREQIKPKLAEAIEAAAANAVDDLEVPPFDIDEQRAAKRAVTKIDLDAIEGFIFEAFISAISGVPLPNDTKSTWDFPRPSKAGKDRLSKIFTPELKGKIFDAKRTLSQDTVSTGSNSIGNKVVSSIRDKTGLLQPSDFSYANAGGRIDTVPAMLTPGEFVIKKSAAESIGYSNLNKMNKAGHYAKGGTVGIQRFADGGTPLSFSGMGGDGGGTIDKALSLEKALQKLGMSAEEAARRSGVFANELTEGADNFGALETALDGSKIKIKRLGSAADTAAKKEEAVNNAQAQKLKELKKQERGLGQKRAQTEARRATMQSAQQMIFLGAAVSATISQFGLLDEATANAVTASIGMATTLMGLGGTVLDMVEGFKLNKIAAQQAALAEQIAITTQTANTEAVTASTAANIESAASEKLKNQSLQQEGSGVGGKVMGALIAAAVVFAIAQGFKSYFTTKSKQEREKGNELISKAREGADISADALVQARQKELDFATKARSSQGGGLVGGAVGGAVVGTATGGPVGLVLGAIAGGLAGAFGGSFNEASKEILDGAGEMARAELEAARAVVKFNQDLKNIDLKGLKGAELLGARSKAATTGIRAILDASNVAGQRSMDTAGAIGAGGADVSLGGFSGIKSGGAAWSNLFKGFQTWMNADANDLAFQQIDQMRQSTATQKSDFRTTVLPQLLKDIETEQARLIRSGMDLANVQDTLAVAQEAYKKAVISSSVLQPHVAKKQADATLGALEKGGEVLEAQYQENKKIEAAAAKARNEERKLILQTSSVLRKLAASDIYINRFNGALEGAVSAISGDFTSRIREADIGDISNVGDRDLFDAEVDRAGAILGAEGKLLAERVKKISEIIEVTKTKLPGLSLTGLEDTKSKTSIGSFLDTALGPAFSGAGDEIKNKIIKELIRPEGGPITAEDIEAVIGNLEGLAQDEADALKKGIDTLRANVAAYDQAWKQAISQKNKELVATQRYLDTIEAGRGRIAQARGFTRDTRTKEAARTARAQVALAGTGTAGDVRGVGARARVAKATMIQAEDLEKAAKRNKESYAEISKKGHAAADAFGKLKTELERLADQSALVADVMSDIERERAKRQAVADTLEEYTFATNQGRADMMKSFAALQRVLQTGTLASIPDSMRGAVKGLLDKFADIDLLPGMTGGDISKQLQVQELDKLMRMASGGQRGISQAQMQQIFNASTQEEKLINELQNINRKEAQAREELFKLEQQNTTELRKVLQGLQTYLDKQAIALPGAAPEKAGMIAAGGPVYKADGGTIFQPRGTDTVPAMLTPGEFVMRKSAVDKIGVGNLAALNAGGPIYRADGGSVNVLTEDQALDVYYSRLRKLQQKQPRLLTQLYKERFVGEYADYQNTFLKNIKKGGASRNENLTGFDPANNLIRQYTKILRGNRGIFSNLDARGALVSKDIPKADVEKTTNELNQFAPRMAGIGGNLLRRFVPEMYQQMDSVFSALESHQQGKKGELQQGVAASAISRIRKISEADQQSVDVEHQEFLAGQKKTAVEQARAKINADDLLDWQVTWEENTGRSWNKLTRRRQAQLTRQHRVAMEQKAREQQQVKQQTEDTVAPAKELANKLNVAAPVVTSAPPDPDTHTPQSFAELSKEERDRLNQEAEGHKTTVMSDAGNANLPAPMQKQFEELDKLQKRMTETQPQIGDPGVPNPFADPEKARELMPPDVRNPIHEAARAEEAVREAPPQPADAPYLEFESTTPVATAALNKEITGVSGTLHGNTVRVPVPKFWQKVPEAYRRILTDRFGPDGIPKAMANYKAMQDRVAAGDVPRFQPKRPKPRPQRHRPIEAPVPEGELGRGGFAATMQEIGEGVGSFFVPGQADNAWRALLAGGLPWLHAPVGPDARATARSVRDSARDPQLQLLGGAARRGDAVIEAVGPAAPGPAAPRRGDVVDYQENLDRMAQQKTEDQMSPEALKELQRASTSAISALHPEKRTSGRSKYRAPFKFNSGGSVDSVPAMLTPGEFVMSKGAVNRHGMGFMKQLNQGHAQGFNQGGPVYLQDGGGGFIGLPGSRAKPNFRGDSWMATGRDVRGKSATDAGNVMNPKVDAGAIGLVFENFISNIQTTFVDNVIPAFTMLTMAMNNLAQVWSKGLTMNHRMNVNGALNIDGVDGQRIAGDIQQALATNISGTIKETLDSDAKRFTA